MRDEDSMHLLLSGRVQGVGFRAWARARARGHGLRGWIRNRADGTVEVSAAGDPGALERFRDGLGEGPPHARVEAVRHEGAGRDLPEEGFHIRY